MHVSRSGLEVLRPKMTLLASVWWLQASLADPPVTAPCLISSLEIWGTDSIWSLFACLPVVFPVNFYCFRFAACSSCRVVTCSCFGINCCSYDLPLSKNGHWKRSETPERCDKGPLWATLLIDRKKQAFAVFTRTWMPDMPTPYLNDHALLLTAEGIAHKDHCRR